MPMNKAHYPKDWLTLRKTVLARAKYGCECRGECGSTHQEGPCAAGDGQLIQRVKLDLAVWVRAYAGAETRLHNPPIKVVLTTAHICQESMCNDLTHLLALCQLCHLRLDAKQHATSRAATRAKKQARP